MLLEITLQGLREPWCPLMLRDGAALRWWPQGQRLYHRDFSAIAAGTIQHPYMATANSAGSTPHNILTGTNFADKAYLTSDHDITFTPKDYVASRQTKGSGIRSEQIS